MTGRSIASDGARRCGALLLAFWSSLAIPQALAADFYHDDDIDVRWDNTLRYSAGFRLEPRNDYALGYANYDDGDRNFAPGLMSDRLDLLSELDITRGDFGLRVSAAGWIDSVYLERNDNNSPATFNPYSVPHDKFTSAVRRLHGEDIWLGDAFVHGDFDLGGMPVSFRAGRYTLLWGESVFFGDNSISAGQAPEDVIKETSQPASYSRDVFLPVWQASTVIQPADNISIAAYYQFEWRKNEVPGSGSYFSYADYLDAGGERIILSPGHFLYRDHDLLGRDTGQYGLSLQVSGSEFTYGFYALRYNAKDPEVYFRPGAPSRGDGTYQLVYPNGIDIYGASLSTYLGDSTVAGEVSYRTNMPLVSYGALVPLGELADNSGHPRYPIGDTLHGQVSSITTFAGSPLWQRADLNLELAANERLSITDNAAALAPSRDKFAAALRATFEPQYFEVLPALDISLPLGLGYGFAGSSSVDSTATQGTGDVEIGVAGTYRKVWQGSLTFTHFIGDSSRQPFADRDFLLFSIQRTF